MTAEAYEIHSDKAKELADLISSLPDDAAPDIEEIRRLGRHLEIDSERFSTVMVAFYDEDCRPWEGAPDFCAAGRRMTPDEVAKHYITRTPGGVLG